MSKRKIPEKVRNAVVFAINHARCINAKFSDVHNTPVLYNDQWWDMDELIKHHIRLYMGSWVVGPLEEILEYDDGNAKALAGWQDEKTVKPAPDHEFGPVEDQAQWPIFRHVKVDMTHDKETQAIIGISELINDLRDPEQRRRVLAYLLEKEAGQIDT